MMVSFRGQGTPFDFLPGVKMIGMILTEGFFLRFYHRWAGGQNEKMHRLREGILYVEKMSVVRKGG